MSYIQNKVQDLINLGIDFSLIDLFFNFFDCYLDLVNEAFDSIAEATHLSITCQRHGDDCKE